MGTTDTKFTSQNGRWGLIVQGQVKIDPWTSVYVVGRGQWLKRGVVDGHSVWAVDENKDGWAVLVIGHGVNPLCGAQVLEEVYLQYESKSTCIVDVLPSGGMFTVVGYKGRSRHTYAIRANGSVEDPSAEEVLEARQQCAGRVIVSRHPGAIDWIRQTANLPDDVPVLASATAENVRGKVVYGNLPLWLAAQSLEYWAVEFGGEPPRGGEYSAEDMISAGARLVRYKVMPY